MATQPISLNNTGETLVCYAPTLITTTGIWKGDNPMDYSLPLFIMQLTLVVVMTRVLIYVLKPLRQPRVISEILAGVILGPSVLGRNKKFANVMFPLRSIIMLETMSNVGLLYFLFLVGVEMDLAILKRNRKMAIIVAIAGMILPFMIGVAFSFMLHQRTQVMKQGTFILFLGVALSVTAFPVLVRILAELKLLNTEMGRVAISSALLNDMCAWIVLAFAIAIAENETLSSATIWVLLSSVTFVTFCIMVVRPFIDWMIRQTPEGETISEFHIGLILTGVLIAGFVTDAIGTHSVFGAFVFGLVIPNGQISLTLIERLEDFVSGLLLPLFFATSGLKTDITAIQGFQTWGILGLVIILACLGKVAGTLLVALYYEMPFNEGLTLGLLMNTKGLVEMIVLNVGKDERVLDDKSFAIMVVVAVVITATVTPIVTVIYKPARRIASYRRRTIQSTKPGNELRVLVCIHTPRNVPTIIKLLEASFPNKRSPISAFVLHLVELTGRATSMLIVHSTRQSDRPTTKQANDIFNAFEEFKQLSGWVSVQPLTAISPYSTMHEDICSVALDKRVAFVIVPFHKQQTVDGTMESTNNAFRTIYQNVLLNAPCSVGILVDRGLNGSTRVAPNKVSHHIVVLFFGGPDDREALSYGTRMSEHPGINLTVVRFIAGGDEEKSPSGPGDKQDTLTIMTDTEREKKHDIAYLNEFKSRIANDESIHYSEAVVNNGEETVAAIRSIDNIHDLFIVGRGQLVTSPLTAGLTDWSECPELGAIGDLLASADFTVSYSVLVVQQYIGLGVHHDGDLDTPDDSERLHDNSFSFERTNSHQPPPPPI